MAWLDRLLDAYRNDDTPGVPEGGVNLPDKAEVRAGLQELAEAILAIATGGASFDETTYPKLALRLDYPAGTKADVLTGPVATDPSSPPANAQGRYEKLGASGAGSWVWKGPLPQADLTALTAVVNGKASQLDLTTLGGSVAPLISALIGSNGAVSMQATDEGGWRFTDAYGFEVASIEATGVVVPGGRFSYAANGGFSVVDNNFFEFGGRSAASGGSVPSYSVGVLVGIESSGLKDTSVRIAADISGSPFSTVALEYADNAGFVRSKFTPAVQPVATTKDSVAFYQTAKFEITGLTPSRQYWVRPRIDGFTGGKTLKFKTMPPVGAPANYAFWLMSCSKITKTPPIQMLEFIATNPGGDALFAAMIGDKGYTNLTVDNILVYRSDTDRAWRAYPSAEKLILAMCLLTMYDDHDYIGGNDNNFDSPIVGSNMREAGKRRRQAMYETLPMYDRLQDEDGETDPDKILPCFQFDCATSRHIVMDTRSQRRHGVNATILGTGTNPPDSYNQLQAIKDRLVAAGAAGKREVFLYSPCGTGAAYDGWMDGDWSPEFVDLCNFIRDTPGIPFVTILSGDFHWSGVDFSGYTDRSTGGFLMMPQIMSSPIYSGSLSGGGDMVWNGVSTKKLGDELAVKINVLAAGGWEARIYGLPYDEAGNATLLGTYKTADIPALIQRDAATISAPAGSVVQVPVLRKGIATNGGGSAHWVAGSESGDITFRPMQGRQTVPVTAPAVAGQTKVFTLSSIGGGAAAGPNLSVTITAT